MFLIPNMKKAKEKMKRNLIIGGVVISVWGCYSIADKYFNKGAAEENLRNHIMTVYQTPADVVSCPQTHTVKEENRVECTAMVKGVERIYLCRGLFDGFDL